MASQITRIFCMFLGFIVATQALQCYQCKTNNPNDSCFQTPTSVAKTTCVPGIQKCIVRRTYDQVNKNVVEFERDCEFTVPFLGGKTECTTKGNLRECQVACRDDFCNDVAENQIEACVANQCRSSASLNIIMTPLLLLGVVMKFVF